MYKKEEEKKKFTSRLCCKCISIHSFPNEGVLKMKNTCINTSSFRSVNCRIFWHQKSEKRVQFNETTLFNVYLKCCQQTHRITYKEEKDWEMATEKKRENVKRVFVSHSFEPIHWFLFWNCFESWFVERWKFSGFFLCVKRVYFTQTRV